MNKRANISLFGFFFVLMIISGIFLFITIGLQLLLHDYALDLFVDISDDLLTGPDRLSTISGLALQFAGLSGYYDILFLALLVAMFVESVIAAIKAREAGILSFFGLITLGNIFLIFLLSYAIQVRGWFLNEIYFRVVVNTPVNTPFMDFFFDWSYIIAIIWYMILIVMNQFNLESIVDKLPSFRKKDRGEFEE